jgi:hypothetical protein
MGDSNLHNHKRVPFFIAGRAGAVPGGLHLEARAGTPLANVMLSLLHALGLEDLSKFGDGTAPFDLTAGALAPESRRPTRCVPPATHIAVKRRLRRTRAFPSSPLFTAECCRSRRSQGGGSRGPDA